MIVDCLVMSASRPDFLKKTLKSFFKFVKWEEHELRFLCYEACILKEESKECVKFMRGLGRFDVVEWGHPPLKFGPTMEHMFKNHVTSSLMFFILDDHVFTREVDLDTVINLFIEHSSINQITFSKRIIPSVRVKKFYKETFEFPLADTVYPLTTSLHWMFTQCIWRMSFIIPHMDYSSNYSHWKTNHRMKENLGLQLLNGSETKFRMKDAQWVRQNQGTYYYGRIGDPPHVLNIGSSKPMLVARGEVRKGLSEEAKEFVRTTRKRIERGR